MALSPHTYQFLVGVFASMGSVLYGYDLGVIAGVVGSSSYDSKFSPTPAMNGVIVSLFAGGAFLDALFAGPTGDWVGGRGTILVGSLIFILGGAIQTAAQTIHYLYAGRALAGLGVGFFTMIIPISKGEIAHPSIRGRVTGLHQFVLGIGALMAGWITYACYINMQDD